MSGARMISTTSRRELSSSFFFPARQGAEGNSAHSSTEILACFLPGRAKDLSAPLYKDVYFTLCDFVFGITVKMDRLNNKYVSKSVIQTLRWRRCPLLHRAAAIILESIIFTLYGATFNTEQDRKCMHNITLSARSCNHCCSGKAISITYSECMFVDLGTQQEHVCSILSSVACMTLK